MIRDKCDSEDGFSGMRGSGMEKVKTKDFINKIPLDITKTDICFLHKKKSVGEYLHVSFQK
jgi:hypothetical protein